MAQGKKYHFLPDILLVCFVLVYTLGAFLFSRHDSYYDMYKLAGKDSISFEKAQVVSVDTDTVSEHKTQKGLFTGSQELSVKLLSGTKTGTIYRITNYLNYDASYRLHTGDTVIVSVNSTGDGKTVNTFVNVPYRTPWLALFASGVIILLCVIGGQKGFRAALGICFTITSILFVFIPLLYRGISPVPASLLLAAVTASVTLFLTGGTGKKTMVAVTGTLVCLILAVGVQSVFCRLPAFPDIHSAIPTHCWKLPHIQD